MNIDVTGMLADDITSYGCRQGRTCIYVSTSHQCERCCAEYNRALRVQTRSVALVLDYLVVVIVIFVSAMHLHLLGLIMTRN